MDTPDRLADDEYAEAVFDCIQEQQLLEDELFDEWEEELINRLQASLGDEIPEENHVMDMLNDMRIAILGNDFADDDGDDDDIDDGNGSSKAGVFIDKW